MIVSKQQIKSFIPQREPFIMIDNLIEATNEKFETNFTIRQDNIFLDRGILSEFALIENIAQSSAAGLYYLGTKTEAKSIDGFIGAITKLKVFALPTLHDTIYTIITPINHFANMYMLKGENFLNGKKLLECEIKLAGL